MNSHKYDDFMEGIVSEFNRKTDNIHHHVIANKYHGQWGVYSAMIESFRVKEDVLPFWNYLVKLEDHDHGQHFLDVLGGNFYFDTHATILIKYQSGQPIHTEQRLGIIRGGCFFRVFNSTGNKAFKFEIRAYFPDSFVLYNQN